MARNKKVEILSNDKEVLHPMTDGDCVIFEDGQTLTQKLSEDDSVKYTPEIVNSSPMFKVGEGNTVDYSDNVLDGAYERASLQGQTYVNYIQESSADEITLPTPFTEYERTQHNTLTSDEEGTLGINLVGQSYVNALQHDSEEEYVVLGESLEFQEKKVEYTNEGQIKSAMLKGQTLVNLATHKCFWNNYSTAGEFLTQPLKNNTKYMIILNSLENVQCVSLASKSWNIMQTLMGTEDNGSYKGDLSQKLVFTFNVSENDVDVVTNIRILLSSAPTSGPDYQVMLLEYQEGMENWDIPYFEGMQSVTVSTKLENLCHKHTTSDLAKNGKTFNTNSINDRLISLASVTDGGGSLYEMKSNTKYLVQFKISNLVLDGLESIGLQFSVSTVDSGNCLFENGTITGLITANGVYRVVLTTTDLISTSSVEIKGIATEWENSGSTLRSLTISNIMYVEYQNGMENWDLPYFEDYQVMKPVQVESVNKNEFNTKSIQNYYGCTPTIHDNNSFTLVGLDDRQYKNISFIVDVKPNTVYKLSYNVEYISGNPNALYDIYTIDNKYYAHGNNEPFNTANNTQLSIRFYVNASNNNNGTIKYYDIQLEQSSTATEYVPHQSKTTYSWDEVILRKIGDVEDTLDLTTGEWVQRIGEINSNEMTIANISNGNNMLGGTDYCNVLTVRLPNAKNASGYELIEQELYIKSDKKTCLDRGDANWHLPSNVGKIVKHTSINYKEDLWVIVPTDITTNELAINYLKDNPFTVQYVLDTPIIHKVSLSRPNLQTYDDITHVHTKCLDGTLIPNIYLPSDISYPAILESGKNYNVSINHTQVNTDNPLKVNVGGTEITMTDSRMTLTTPTTLANSNVSFTGKGNKIKESMLIKNSSLLTRDLPHFNGIGSVQLGKTIENLCSSNHERVGSGGSTQSETDDSITITVTKQGSVVRCFELTTLLENGKKYFVYCPSSITTTTTSKIQIGFQRTYNGNTSYLRQPAGTSIIQYIIDQVDNQYTHLTVGCHDNLNIGDVYTIQRPIICEYEQGMENWDWESIGYFTGTKNIGNEFMRVQNKNLFDYQDYSNKIKNIDGIILIDNGFIADCSVYGGVGNKLVETPIYFDAQENTIYRISFYTKHSGDFKMILRVDYTDGTASYLTKYTEGVHTALTNNDKTVRKITYSWYTQQNGGSTTIQNLQIEQTSSAATTYTAHKHNGLYITKDQPIELTWEQGQVQVVNNGDTYTSAINNALSNRIRNKGLLNLKPNTTYRVSLGNKTDYKYHIACFNNYDAAVSAITGIGTSWVSSFDTIFTTTKDMHKIGINVAKVGDGAITPSESVHVQVRLEEVTDVVLKGIGNVHDELDITRGIYTQRISEIILDGSENWSSDTNGSGATRFYNSLCNDIYIEYGTTSSSANLICNNFNHPIENIYTDTNNSIQVVIPNGLYFICTECSTIEEWRTWLKNNKTIIQYALKTPIVHQVFVGNKNEANTEVAKPNDVFTLPTLYTEQTHIDLTNNGIMPKVQSRDYIAYPVLPMISRTYTLQHNLTGGVSNLTVDLLGRTQEITYQEPKALIYSPVTMDAILHHELRISGKGKISRVMYIDGGYMDRDIPYIEGMKNAVNPIVKNVGKNLLNENSLCFKPSTINLRYYDSFSCKPNTTYYFYSDKGESKCNWYTCDSFIDSQTFMERTSVIGVYQGYGNIFTTPSNCYNLLIYTGGSLTVDPKQIKTGIYEVSDLTHEPYKENICYVDCGEIRLTPDMFEQGSVNNTGDSYESDKNTAKTRIRTKELIELEPSVQYVILGDDSMYKYSAHFFDKDGMQVKGSYDLSWKANQPFTAPSDAPMAAFFVAYQDNRNFTVDDVDFNFQLVKVSEIKQLRSLPNGVHDEIDLETGKYIQRVGEITFNGTENWIVGYSSWDNKYTYYNNNFVDIKLMKGDNGSGQAYYDAVRCPQLHRSYMGRLASVLIDGVCSYYYSGYQRIFISKQDCATVDELKLWLQENPITVQYELPEPIVKDIVIHNYPHSYEGGHVIIENGDPNTPIPAQLTYRTVTNRSGQIQQHTEQVEKQEREINELETLILANIHLSQTR